MLRFFDKALPIKLKAMWHAAMSASAAIATYQYMGVEPKIGVFPPKSSILIGFSIINHPFWGTPIFGNIHISTGVCPWTYFAD